MTEAQFETLKEAWQYRNKLHYTAYKLTRNTKHPQTAGEYMLREKFERMRAKANVRWYEAIVKVIGDVEVTWTSLGCHVDGRAFKLEAS